VDCGDYLALFDLRQPIYPSTIVYIEQPSPPFDARRAEFVEGLDHYLRMADASRRVSAEELCTDFTQAAQRLGNLLLSMGLPWNLASSTTQWLIDIRNSCTDPTATRQSVAAAVRRVRASFTDLVAAVKNPDPLAGRDLSHVTAIATRAFGDDSKAIQFTHTIRQSLTNSSTNYNRKRAAYVLDRFFCDDLIPINVENVAEHQGDRHASDPACMACHYRLDPMAGFFKDYGIMFTAFTRANTIVFDDMATMEKATYEQAWLAPSHSARRWNIGYVRSVKDDALNSYGENLEDLFRIVKTAPEVKRCVVKRMNEYFVGDSGTIDAGFLDYLTERFVETSARNSTLAFKETAAQIVLSRAFTTRDPEAGTCYDVAPGHGGDESPPCRVNHLLQRHCVSCHGGARLSAGLDLSRWVRGPDGRMTFPHAPEPGQSRPRGTTFQQMVDRLSSSNPDTRMPLDRHMSPLERQELFVWATEMLDERSK
jgi:hypothetical protein